MRCTGADIRTCGRHPANQLQAAERLGYPTQKPEALLERIIQASSNEGDIVLDPFCGCGTAIVAAQKLGRRWIGIDITHLAITLIKTRLKRLLQARGRQGLRGDRRARVRAGRAKPRGHDPYQFQWWALGLVGARPAEQKKGADKGIDGRLYFHDEATAPRPSRSSSASRRARRAHRTCATCGAWWTARGRQIGVLITMQEPTQHMRARGGRGRLLRLAVGRQLPAPAVLTVGQLLAGKGIKYPNVEGMDRTFKKAPRARTGAADAASLFDPEDSSQVGN